MEFLILSGALLGMIDIPTDFGPVEKMIFGSPPPSVRLLNPPESEELTKQLLEFAKRRPYSSSILETQLYSPPTTVEIARLIQEYEHLLKRLPPLEEAFRFPDRCSLENELNKANSYYSNLAEDAAFMLEEEREIVREMFEHYKKYEGIYRDLLYIKSGTLTYLDSRLYLNNVKQGLNEKFYKNGTLPPLIFYYKK